MAGRPRKPSALHILNGTAAARNANRGDMITSGKPKMPSGLSRSAQKFWRRVVPTLIDLGFCSAQDADELALMARWWCTADALLTRVEAGALDVVGRAATADQQFQRIACRFGMTPVDRAKLRVEPKAPPALAVRNRKNG